MKALFPFIALFLIALLAAISCSTPAQIPPSKSEKITTPTTTTPQPEPEVIKTSLIYHDRQAEAFLAAKGYGYIVRFLLINTPFTINKIDIVGANYGTGYEGNKFIVAIWDKTQTTMYTAEYPLTKFAVDQPTLVEIDIPDVVVNDEFYVHVYAGTGRNEGLHIGADDSVSNEHSDVTIQANGKYKISDDWPYPAYKWIGDKSRVNWLIAVTGTSTARISTPSSTTIDNNNTYDPVTAVTIDNPEHAIEMLESAWPELFQELNHISNLEWIENTNKKAIQDIAIAALQPKYKYIFEEILEEGIRDKRKYCTPLEALVWITLDDNYDLNSLLDNYHLDKLLDCAWKNTNISNHYNSDRWTNFDEVTSRLSSPMLISKYMEDNIVYDKDIAIGKGHYQAEKTFTYKKGPCSWQAAFGYYCLAKNGYHYNDFEDFQDDSSCILSAYEGDSLTWSDDGHVTCLYNKNNTFYLINNGRLQGPFNTIEDAATRTWRNWEHYEFRDINGKLTKKVGRTH